MFKQKNDTRLDRPKGRSDPSLEVNSSKPTVRDPLTKSISDDSLCKSDYGQLRLENVNGLQYVDYVALHPENSSTETRLKSP